MVSDLDLMIAIEFGMTRSVLRFVSGLKRNSVRRCRPKLMTSSLSQRWTKTFESEQFSSPYQSSRMNGTEHCDLCAVSDEGDENWGCVDGGDGCRCEATARPNR